MAEYDERAIIAQRLKRLPSVLFKLERFPEMRLSQMQDIGGCRAVLSSAKQVYAVREAYARSKSQHQCRSEKDYIVDPQPTGYRGIHLIFKYRSNRSSDFEDLLIEIQLRSRPQHAWATAVETVGTFLRQSLKSNRGEKRWLYFFQLASSLFAESERMPGVPGVAMVGAHLREAISVEMESLKVQETLTAYGHALRVATSSARSGAHFFLLTLDPKSSRLSVMGYRRESFEQAAEDYLKFEKQAEESVGSEVVLVAMDSLRALQRAYPNYFLDTQVFLQRLTTLVRGRHARQHAPNDQLRLL